jgi:tellurite resistance protein
MALSEGDRFNLEVLKLLLNLAWVDGEVAQQEVNMLLGLGRSRSVPEGALQQLKASVDAGRRPAEPDFDLLRTRSDEALQAARALVLVDGRVHPEETALLKRVQAALMGG